MSRHCHHNIANKTSTIEVTALSKTIFQNWKVCKKNNLSWVWGTDRNIRPSVSQADITRQISWCQTVTLGVDFFLSTLYTHACKKRTKKGNWKSKEFILSPEIGDSMPENLNEACCTGSDGKNKQKRTARQTAADLVLVGCFNDLGFESLSKGRHYRPWL